MFNWGLNEGTGKDSGNKVKYASFPEGITRIRLLLGEGERPYMRWTHWMPQFKRKLTCPGFGCPIDELIKNAKANKIDPPYNSSKTYAINIYNIDAEEGQILEEGITMVEGLQDAIGEWLEDGDISSNTNLAELIIKVRKKKNSSNKTSWSFTLEGIEPLDDKATKAFEDRIDFTEYFKPPTVEQVQQVLLIQESDIKEAQKKYNEILYGVKPKEEEKEEENLGTELELE